MTSPFEKMPEARLREVRIDCQHRTRVLRERLEWVFRDRPDVRDLEHTLRLIHDLNEVVAAFKAELLRESEGELLHA